MSNDNPSDSTTSAASQPVSMPCDAAISSSETPSLEQLAYLGLRLLGVYFLVDGGANIVHALWVVRMSIGVDEPNQYGPPPERLAAFVYPAIQLFAGFVFLLRARWVVESFLIPSRNPPAA